ncbi:MAG TPA: MerC domain-containing protein [Lysobacter sp.]|nr:MerC domain-containing protein [Lysobacter sp.]
MSPHHTRSLLDRLGALGSVLCALHCAAIPLLIALAPSFGAAAWLGGGFELGFVVFATGLGLFSMFWGYRRHGAVRALGLLLPGLALLWLAIVYRPLHEAVVPHAMAMTLGGTLVGLAHLANLRLNHEHVHDAHCSHAAR